jgi:hypothetical protein
MSRGLWINSFKKT